ncbi:MAG: hypothetical protein SZ59_C0001G0012 [candidate division TM6 bacterium GW2011_GWF2_28_16]|nr:MAG: hypothetical protein SZ59_C0001G0012 [candidate division TM6 bacterium GW2011_GWF2_28_16]
MKLKFNLLKYIFVNLFLFNLLNSCFCANSIPSNFIIEKDNTKVSRNKNAIKETIGSNIKSGLDNIADLNKTIAKIQIKATKIQKQLINNVEDLVDAAGNFKKAKTGDLNKSLNLIKDINSKLNEQLKVVKNIKSDLDKDNCLKELGHK